MTGLFDPAPLGMEDDEHDGYLTGRGESTAPSEADSIHSSQLFGEEQGYHVRTQLADGRPALVIDPGSVGNLCGDKWAKMVAQAAANNGKEPSYDKRTRPLNVSGVGHGSQQAGYDCKLPVAFKQTDGQTVSQGLMSMPTVGNSDLPGLLGLTALRKNRAILDFEKMQLFFCGPGDYILEQSLPSGTDSFQCEAAPSGHMVIPCCE